MRAFLAETGAAFPGFRIELHAMHHADDAVIVEATFRGTHRGAWRGLPATGRGQRRPRSASVAPGQDLSRRATVASISGARTRTTSRRHPPPISRALVPWLKATPTRGEEAHLTDAKGPSMSGAESGGASMAEQYQYDVFLSYSSGDLEVVRELAERLKRDGLRVWFDKWKIAPGAMILRGVDEGLATSRTLVLAMSKHTTGTSWAAMESGSFRFRDPTNAERRFIPLRLDDTEIHGSLGQFAYVDWRTKDQGEYTRLLAACAPSPAVAAPSMAASKKSVRVLKTHQTAFDLATVPGGDVVAVAMFGGPLQTWDLAKGLVRNAFASHKDSVLSVAVSADGGTIVSGSSDRTIKVWRASTGECLRTIEAHTSSVDAVALTSGGKHIISASPDKTLRVWSLENGECVRQCNLTGRTSNVCHIAVSHDGDHVALGVESDSSDVFVYDVESLAVVWQLKGHVDYARAVAFTHDDRLLISAGRDKALKVWNLLTGQCQATWEGHSGDVTSVSVTPDDRHVVSASIDKTVRVWSVDTGECLATLQHDGQVYSALTTPDGRSIVSATLNKTLNIWPFPAIKPGAAVAETAQYTNAKVLLVGESGVGKTGLAYRLTENQFHASVSTGAAWATQLKLPAVPGAVGIEREIWLWDFAGQADYRLIQQLYMDETALAVLVFNPQNDDPFEGLGQWDRDLQRAARRSFRKLLVAGRCDRGGLTVSQQSIDAFMEERGFTRYLETSALQGTGCDALRDAIVAAIPWEEIPWTASPRIFKLLKEAIVRLKDEGRALLRVAELKQQLEMQLPERPFTLEQLRAVVGLLAGPGVVWQLEFGDVVLLQPERVNAYASAVIRSVRAHREEIGCIKEETVLAGELDYQDVVRLPPDQEQIVLRAMHQTFVDHGLCLREHTDQGTLLIFPSYFKRERPDLGGHPVVLVTYSFTGMLDEIYATLVVRLHHTPAFERDQLWRFAADFKTPGGRRLGLKLSRKHEGVGELDVYFEPGIPLDVQVTFIRYVQEHLDRKARDVVRERYYVCPKCGCVIENRNAIKLRLAKGLKDIVCAACEGRVTLWDLVEEKFASEDLQRRVRELDDVARAAIETESRELVVVGHAYAIAGEAGQLFRQYPKPEHGIDGEIELRDASGQLSGRFVYLQLRLGDSYRHHRTDDGSDVFTIENTARVERWLGMNSPVMLVLRTADGTIRWMDVAATLKSRREYLGRRSLELVFEGEPFTALALRQLLVRRPPLQH